MKKIFFSTLFAFAVIACNASADTLTNWQIYLNNKVIYAGNEIAWSNTLTQKERDTLSKPIELRDIDIYKDSLGITFFCDYTTNLNDYFFLKDENDKLVCIIQKNLVLKRTNGNIYVVENDRTISYIPLWRVFLNYPRNENPKIIKVYYWNPLNNSSSKSSDERLLATLKFFVS